jgi:hypothetical protein
LLAKLSAYGFRGYVLSWIKAFLTNRTQRVKCDGSFSAFCPVTSGVPQGSVLGPLLFLIFINDMPDVLSNGFFKLFADDSKLFQVVNSAEESEQFQTSIDAIANWCEEWQMPLNVEKCKVLHIGSKNQNFEYNVFGSNISASLFERDLGVLLSHNLKPHAHIAQITAKAYQKINLIFRFFETRDFKFLIKMYSVYVRPILEYCSSVWSPGFAKDINCIEQVQKHCFNRIPGFASLNYTEKCIAFGLEFLELRRLKADLILLYKMYSGDIIMDTKDFFSRRADVNLTGPITRQQNNLNVVRSVKKVGEHFFANRIVNVWNSLSPETRNIINNVSLFSIRLNSVDLSRFLRGRFI